MQVDVNFISSFQDSFGKSKSMASSGHDAEIISRLFQNYDWEKGTPFEVSIDWQCADVDLQMNVTPHSDKTTNTSTQQQHQPSFFFPFKKITFFIFFIVNWSQ